MSRGSGVYRLGGGDAVPAEPRRGGGAGDGPDLDRALRSDHQVAVLQVTRRRVACQDSTQEIA